MRIKIRLVALVILAAAVFACLPFHAGVSSKGLPSAGLACSAPVVGGWTTTTANRDLGGGRVEYDASRQCAEDERDRLIGAGVVMALALLFGFISLAERRRDSSAEQRTERDEVIAN